MKKQTANSAVRTEPGIAFAVVVLLGTFIAALGGFVVNAALPSISSDLRAGPSALEWVIAGYALPYGVGLVTGARLGDQFGRRRLFLWGIAGFTLASAACGLAPSLSVLIAARVLQGLAAAALTPQVIASLTAVYTGHARARAVDAYAFTLGSAAVLGQLIGGALLRLHLGGSGWRACFLVNIPVGIGILIAGRRYVVRIPTHSNKLDPVGTHLLGAGLLLLILPLVEGRSLGWPTWTWLCLAASAVVLAIFVGFERRVARRGGSPLIDMSLFHERAMSSGMAMQLAFWMGQGAFFFVFALYCQYGLDFSPLKAGLLFVPMGVGYTTTSTTARHITARLGKQVLATGAILLVLAESALLALTSHVAPGDAWLLGAPLLIDGLGMGLVIGPLVSTIMAGVEPRHVGAASGMLSTGVQIGTAAGVALIGLIFYANLTGDSAADAQRNAFTHVLPYLIGIPVAVTVLVQLLPRPRRDAATAGI